MRWKGQRQSSNVEDRRGGGMVGAGGKMSVLTIVVVIVISVITGKNPLALLQMVGGSQQQSASTSSGPVQQSAAEKELYDFASTILASTEDAWNSEFQRRNAKYQTPSMVIFKRRKKSFMTLHQPFWHRLKMPGTQNSKEEMLNIKLHQWLFLMGMFSLLAGLIRKEPGPFIVREIINFIWLSVFSNS